MEDEQQVRRSVRGGEDCDLSDPTDSIEVTRNIRRVSSDVSMSAGTSL